MEARQNIINSMQILNKQITRIKSDFLGSRTHFGLGIWTRACEKILDTILMGFSSALLAS